MLGNCTFNCQKLHFAIAKNIEKYAAQLGMLNHLRKDGLITDKEHSTIKQNLKRKYDIK